MTDVQTATATTRQHAVSTRVLHWLVAVLVFTTLFIGFVMVNSVASYTTLVTIHKALGVTILVVTVIRVGNRIFHRAPPLPSTVGALERKMVMASELSLYALLLAQPLIGWAMVSAAGNHVVVFGLRLPRIAPFDLDLYGVLRQAHTILAFLLVAAIAAHVSAVLLHSVTLRDGMLRRMTFRLGARNDSDVKPG
ncbi:cytochrome b [Mycobacterium sp. 21AC1]|uniref:cytochrome b n=1 Tax=[Mycobacterium] appelbergii TaxID=2939269 RepID=UPI002939388F|nr:cytochrome b [Mycobacterium sp. 21AC1]MDV3126188.1 cytochrome b [Mycobacterium sp. 21AC1]